MNNDIMSLMSLLLAGLPLAGLAQAQEQSSQPGNSEVALFTGSRTIVVNEQTVTDLYRTYTTQIPLVTLGEELSTSVGSNTTDTVTIGRTVTQTIDPLPTVNEASGQGSVTATGSLAPTASSPPTNFTRPCNGYAALCDRKYSNYTMVGTHNSPFVRPGNAASNQELDVGFQLDDGVRFLQGQIQWPTGANFTDEPHFCHTSCDMLDAGPITSWLARVSRWIEANPREVVTILLGNGPYANVSFIAPWIQRSNITNMAYYPPVFPMRLDDWPTLEEMINANRRVVLFMDYYADQTAYPWLLDEFSQMWETEFNPLNRSFPCDVPHRPPNLTEPDARSRLYLLNHNLNVKVSLLGAELLVPAVPLLAETNSASGNGSLGQSAAVCREHWGRPPNILNVDYYNYGSAPGSVFEAAAQMNGVRYTGRCCGLGRSGVRTGDSKKGVEVSMWSMMLGLVLGACLVM